MILHCGLDCRCTDRTDFLAVDTSHLCLLARVSFSPARSGAVDFDQVLGMHFCNGLRRVVTSQVMMDHEIDLALPGSRVQQHAHGGLAVNAVDEIEVIDTEPFEFSQANGSDEDRLDVGTRDRTLLAVLAEHHEESRLVTDDEDLISITFELTVSGRLAAVPIAALDFLTRLFFCGAIDHTLAIAAAEIEEDYHSSRLDLDPAKLKVKIDRVNRVLIAIAARLDPGVTL